MGTLRAEQKHLVQEGHGFVLASSRDSRTTVKVVEIGRRIRQTVDLKRNEAIWIISSLRQLHSEGFVEGRWLNRFIQGRSFLVSCKRNRAGAFVQFEIFGARRRLRTLFIPVDARSDGLLQFADALAKTTAGPATLILEYTVQRSVDLRNKAVVDGSSYAEVVALGRSSWWNRGTADGGAEGESSRNNTEEIWISLLAMDPESWSLNVLVRLKKALTGVTKVVPKGI